MCNLALSTSKLRLQLNVIKKKSIPEVIKRWPTTKARILHQVYEQGALKDD
jgi:hypothetical protein